MNERCVFRLLPLEQVVTGGWVIEREVERVELKMR